MNNTCPTCGALYNVAEKDIGRRLKCKKCRTALMVTDAGLVPAAGTESVPSPDDQDFDTEPRESSFSRRRKKLFAGENPLAPVGGVPGLLFGIGVFFVLFFTFMQVLASASNLRAVEYEKKLALEEEVRIRELLPKGKKDRSELGAEEQKTYDEKKKKIEDDYFVSKRSADESKRSTEIGNKRSRLFEGYGTMFGFMLLSFGCLGFLRTQEALLLRIVAGIILTGMVLGLFRLALGTGAGAGVGVTIG
ncbi:unnamed protein product [Gemmata massiliana]|uniref:Uncharacterized protein n=1 Tax=Gemmata massiliana TaxID=1210884 RepID=A0A6P2D3A4_9BACT|nr:hypothetical protein [Gemmata massiliana]VTR95573.1 unnamed protein product [Gemmata massiliana]